MIHFTRWYSMNPDKRYRGCVKTDLHRSLCHWPLNLFFFFPLKETNNNNRKMLGETLWKLTVYLHNTRWITVLCVQTEESFHSCYCAFISNNPCATQIECTTLCWLINNLMWFMRVYTITETEASPIVLGRVFPIYNSLGVHSLWSALSRAW